MLTNRQAKTLTFIHGFIVANGYGPSFVEIAHDAGLVSKSGVKRIVDCLVERGFLVQRAHRTRALEVLRLPDGSPVARTDLSRESVRWRAIEAIAGFFTGAPDAQHQSARAVVTLLERNGFEIVRSRQGPLRDDDITALAAEPKRP